ncbi:hypothetical protein PHMEG_00022950 [Phytophthora megakarya]|uniref:Uncharacterized protein n=1 Tax=Phytophthora megakarya TaxID=4795 RepID=A0A225VHF0_9STRA|nr:hypothetical protein PHMEG_00022950 [Phytophthora megakarya]
MVSLECIQRIRDELEAHGDLQALSPPLAETKSLCEFVTDGRALCLLTNAVLESEVEELSKKPQRSGKQLSKFHALERVRFFIKWCRTSKLEEHQVFTIVQLLDEVNETAVSETIVALRNKMRQGLKAANSMSHNARVSTSSTTSSGSNRAKNVYRLSSFLNKLSSAPVVVTKSSQNKSRMNHRVSLTSSVSSNQSRRDVEEPVPTDEENINSRLRIPSIFKNNNNNINTSATLRSSVISNALDVWHLWWFGNATFGYPLFKGLQPSDVATKIKRKRHSEWTNLIKHLFDAVKPTTGRDLQLPKRQPEADVLFRTAINNVPVKMPTSRRTSHRADRAAITPRRIREALHEANPDA